jgi:hypothetical protein
VTAPTGAGDTPRLLSKNRSTRRKLVRYKLVDEKPKTFVLVFETNDELSQGLKKLHPS